MFVQKTYKGIWKCSECGTIVNNKPGKCKTNNKNCSIFEFYEIKKEFIKEQKKAEPIKKKQKLFYIHNGIGFVDIN